MLHPVVWMGALIGSLDRHIERGHPRREKVLGIFLGLVPILVFVIGLTLILGLIRSWLGAIIWVIACAIVFKTMFAIRALEKHTAPMVEDLKRGDLEAARKKASMVVSRDVSKLDQEHVNLMRSGDGRGKPGR